MKMAHLKHGNILTAVRLHSLILFAVCAFPASAGEAEFYAGGLPSAPVKLEVFSDYQCPSCRTFYMTALRYVLTDYAMQNRVSVVYHDLPLQTHQYSREASRYALAAQRLGREYWLRLTEALYENQAHWSRDGRFDVIAVRSSGRRISPGSRLSCRTPQSTRRSRAKSRWRLPVRFNPRRPSFSMQNRACRRPSEGSPTAY